MNNLMTIHDLAEHLQVSGHNRLHEHQSDHGAWVVLDFGFHDLAGPSRFLSPKRGQW